MIAWILKDNKKSHEQVYAHQFDNLNEMQSLKQLTKIHNNKWIIQIDWYLSKLNQLITFQNNKILDPKAFTDELYQNVKEKVIPIFYNLIWETEAGGKFSNTLYEASIPLIHSQTNKL